MRAIELKTDAQCPHDSTNSGKFWLGAKHSEFGLDSDLMTEILGFILDTSRA